MLPTLIGGAFGLAIISVESLMISGTAGAGYGLGRKYGRIACEQLDRLEGRGRQYLENKAE